MVQWKYTLKGVNELINDDRYNHYQLMTKIAEKLQEFAKSVDDEHVKHEFQELAKEILEEVELENFGDSDEVDYYLGEMYDLCDSTGVWVE